VAIALGAKPSHYELLGRGMHTLVVVLKLGAMSHDRHAQTIGKPSAGASRP